jgi:hypothetical protein
MGAGADAKALEIAGSKPAPDLSRSVYILSFRLIEVIHKIVNSARYVYSNLALARQLNEVNPEDGKESVFASSAMPKTSNRQVHGVPGSTVQLELSYVERSECIIV